MNITRRSEGALEGLTEFLGGEWWPSGPIIEG